MTPEHALLWDALQWCHSNNLDLHSVYLGGWNVWDSSRHGDDRLLATGPTLVLAVEAAKKVLYGKKTES